MIIQGPHAAGRLPTRAVLDQLHALAKAAGQTLEFCRCGRWRELLAHVRAARASEFTLIDPGELARQAHDDPDSFQDALDQLDRPYVEVHDDCSESLTCGAHHAPVATIISQGDLGQGYRIALAIALRQLGGGGPSPALRVAA